MTNRKYENAVAEYRDAVSALEAARAGISAYEDRAKVSGNYRAMVGTNPDRMRIDAAVGRADAAHGRAGAQVNECDPRVTALREFMRAELVAARQGFAELVADPPELKTIDAVAEHAKAIEAFVDSKARRDALGRRLYAAYVAVGDALTLLRVERKAAKLPPPIEVRTPPAAHAPLLPPGDAAGCDYALDELDRPRNLNPREGEDVNARELAEAADDAEAVAAE